MAKMAEFLSDLLAFFGLGAITTGNYQLGAGAILFAIWLKL